MFPYDNIDSLETFLSKVRFGTLMTVPAYLALLFFFTREEGWHWSFLVFCVLPPLTAFLGFQAKRDIRPGLGMAALALAVAPLPLVGAVEFL
ncbi:hypothetical protein [Streptomyces chryseus]|uniref:Uncharacterized protein n=1 Tax=Streptomyces chryseus TaxID=68186 RepID=A0ABQ3E2W6_9ACTN|nr:hypothetical protein [Streptomyces chryseus]GGW96168.1 hypothetical protein GCM10010353_09260 [Streptomyces chryseus]GHB21993.1 hypothetical protein GCM10010346_52050 [Streptomyces chryseus]